MNDYAFALLLIACGLVLWATKTNAMNANDRYVGQDLIWVETVAMLSTNPQAARPGDIERLASELMQHRAALFTANDLCRTMHAIAARDGQANWEGFQVRLLDALLDQHRLLWPETHKE